MKQFKKVLEVKNYCGYDTYRIPLEDKVGSWREVLDHIESVLDSQYCDLNKMVGCKIEAEIIEMTQEDIDKERWEYE